MALLVSDFGSVANSSGRTLVQLNSLTIFLLFVLSSFIAVVAQSKIKTLPGYSGTLPFNLETGYVSVDRSNDEHLFYYFIESERVPVNDPLVLWLSGGPGCSSFSGLVYEIGPLKFDFPAYSGGLPSLIQNPYSWTQISNIIFLDAPIGSGFSYAITSEGYYNSDTKSAQDISYFLKKWLLDHPRFSKNPIYIGGDSYAGKIVPMVVLEISKDNEACDTPYQPLQLHGYILGNPLVNPQMAVNSIVLFAHRMGLISDEYYESARRNCHGEFLNVDPNNALCVEAIELIKECISRIDNEHILEVACGVDEPKQDEQNLSYRFSEDVLLPLWRDKPECRKYGYLLSYAWANDANVREALHVRNGTITKWQRCNRNLSYVKDVPDVFQYHQVLREKEYRALVYSGDHDMAVPFVGTLEWIKSLNLTMDVSWRPWFVDDQIAGYTEKYKLRGYNLTFATVKGAGHTAPSYKPKECLAMVDRWFSNFPL